MFKIQEELGEEFYERSDKILKDVFKTNCNEFKYLLYNLAELYEDFTKFGKDFVEKWIELLSYLTDFLKSINAEASDYYEIGRTLFDIAYQTKIKDEKTLKLAVEKAKTCFEKAVELDEKFEKAHFYLAGLTLVFWKKLGLKRGDAVKTIEKHFRIVIEINPKNAQAYNNLTILFAICWRELGMEKEVAVKKAKDLIEKAIELDPDEALYHSNLASILIEHPNIFGEDAIEKAEKHIERALELDPDLAPAYGNRAELYYKHHEKIGVERKKAIEKAKEFFEKDLELNPNRCEIHRSYAEFLIKHWRDLGLSEDEAFEKIEFHLSRAWELRDQIEISSYLFEQLLKLVNDYFESRFEETKECRYLFAQSQLLKDVGDESWKEKLKRALELYEKLPEDEKSEVKKETEKLFSKFGWCCDLIK